MPRALSLAEELLEMMAVGEEESAFLGVGPGMLPYGRERPYTHVHIGRTKRTQWVTKEEGGGE